jgi:hypothetical protein
MQIANLCSLFAQLLNCFLLHHVTLYLFTKSDITHAFFDILAPTLVRLYINCEKYYNRHIFQLPPDSKQCNAHNGRKNIHYLCCSMYDSCKYDIFWKLEQYRGSLKVRNMTFIRIIIYLRYLCKRNEPVLSVRKFHLRNY